MSDKNAKENADEDLLYCKSLQTRTTSNATSSILDDFIKDSNNDWPQCVGISTDVARVMRG